MSILPPLLYRGSVKNVRGEVSAENLLFEFSDRYSVFDWGEMPDQLEGKGAALALMGKSFFQYLEKPKNWTELFDSSIVQSSFDRAYLESLKSSEMFQRYCLEGLPHHAILNDPEFPWNSPYLKVKKIEVLKPAIDDSQNYQYDIYKTKPRNALVPLEIIFRIGLPPGNSLSKRKPQFPPAKHLLNIPILDFSTKLERGDRYIEYAEAREIAALSEVEWNELQTMTHLIALNLFSFHHQLGLELWDGKIEVAFIEGKKGERSFMLVDSIGIDELRLLYKGKSFSKEFLREVYKHSSWYSSLEAAKKEALINGADFKNICLNKYQAEPQKLDLETKQRAVAVYKSYSNEISSKLGHEKYFGADFNLENYAQRYL